MEEIHVSPTRIGNSWGIIIPKQNADELGLDKTADLHVTIQVTPLLKELVGTFKRINTKKELAEDRKNEWKG